MTATHFFWHIANFIAPAFWLGLAVAIWTGCANRLTARDRSSANHPCWWRGLLLDLAVGITVLFTGLVITDHDGRIYTYSALVLTISARYKWTAWRRS